jgi:hypothetical protein
MIAVMTVITSAEAILRQDENGRADATDPARKLLPKHTLIP